MSALSRLAATATVALAAGVGAGPAAAAWCGNDLVAGDRLPDAAAGHQVHIVYAIPSDGEDRFAELAPGIVDDLERVGAWWRREDPARAPRFDVFAFPGCGGSELANLDLSFVRLSESSATYREISGSALRNLAVEIAALPGLSSDFKRTLVYYDGPVEDVDICGTAFQAPLRRGATFGAVWVRSHSGEEGCGSIGGGGYGAVTAVHELLHELGAVPVEPGPVEACPDDPAHICSPENDIMAAASSSSLLVDHVLDAGRNDYYGHSGSWTDLQDSPWLIRLDAPKFPLAVRLVGAGRGDRVESDVPGLFCPPACTATWDAGTELNLVATEGEPQRRVFLRWRGAGCDETFCSVTVDRVLSVEAVFGPARQPLTVIVRGSGRVVAPAIGLTCAKRCTTSVSTGERVALQARVTRGWRFVGWRGACRSTGRCIVAMSAPRTVTAVFGRRR